MLSKQCKSLSVIKFVLYIFVDAEGRIKEGVAQVVVLKRTWYIYIYNSVVIFLYSGRCNVFIIIPVVVRPPLH